MEKWIAGLLKNIIRYIISQPHKGFSFIKYFKNIFGYKINRIEENNDFIESHFGFSHKNLEKEFIRNKLIIKKKIFLADLFCLGNLSFLLFLFSRILSK